jgi:hypothetical protein
MMVNLGNVDIYKSNMVKTHLNCVQIYLPRNILPDNATYSKLFKKE